MNIIAEHIINANFYSSLRNIEAWLEIRFEHYDWHLTDVDGGWLNIVSPCWLSGDEIRIKIDEFDWQFRWAVFSAYPKGFTPFLSTKPYADCNTSFWTESPSKQLDDSIFEIVCWDSSATIFIGLPEDLAKKILKNAVGSKLLGELSISDS